MEEHMEQIIRVENLYKSFGEGDSLVEVLKGISFDVEKGEFISIMGASGCGKSTLLYLLGALDSPDKGSVFIHDKDINKLKDRAKSRVRRSEIGFVFQFYNLVQNLTVEENILLPLIMDGKKPSTYEKELEEILEIVGLTQKRKVIPSKLSGGQQQRVAIARSVIASPDIILADEPTGNLDSKSGTEIMDLFKRINEEKKITILQVTHSNEAAGYGRRIIHLKDGMIERDQLDEAVSL
jgi:putative ABC transport system ATP-binding protein